MIVRWAETARGELADLWLRADILFCIEENGAAVRVLRVWQFR